MTEDLLDTYSLNEEEKQSDNSVSPKGDNEFPYGNSVYYKSIFGLILSFTIVGFIYSVYLTNIALKRSSESLRDYKKSPNYYSEKSLNRVRTGRKIAWVTVFILIGQVLTFLIVF